MYPQTLTLESDWKLTGFVRAVDAARNRNELTEAMVSVVSLTKTRVESVPGLTRSIESNVVQEWLRLLGTIEIAIKAHTTLPALQVFSKEVLATIVAIDQHINTAMKRELLSELAEPISRASEIKRCDADPFVPRGQHPDEWLLDSPVEGEWPDVYGEMG